MHRVPEEHGGEEGVDSAHFLAAAGPFQAISTRVQRLCH